ncbi:MAG: metal ABC transporter substrate-binding protein [Thermoleophilia bacterium]
MIRALRTPRLATLAVALLLAGAAALVAGCGSGSGSGSDGPRIVVTTSVLGAVVRDLVGDRATVDVLMPNGTDPHEFQPSAKDASRLQEADLVVVNGLGLEESLQEPLAQARSAGVPVFDAGEHVDVRTFGQGEITDDGTGADDPHFWMDPKQMERVVAALAPVVKDATGLDVSASATSLETRLSGLSGELAAQARTIPAADRKLVTGHESMGYFARAFGFRLIGAIVPSLSSQAQPSAGDLAKLRAQIEAERVPAIFTEIGTPPAVAEAVGDETGARVIEVASHNLPDDGSYFTFMRDVMAKVVEGLRP